MSTPVTATAVYGSRAERGRRVCSRGTAHREDAGYNEPESEKGFQFFQKFLKESGILDELEAAGIQEGDTVRMYGLAFDYVTRR